MQVRQELLSSEAEQDKRYKGSTGAYDKRAENNSRSVHFEPERIVIMRRIFGVSMRVTIPVSKYRGIGVLLPNLAEARSGFQVSLVHDDPDLCVALHEDTNPLMIDAAIAEWAQYFELPVIGDATGPVNAIIADGDNNAAVQNDICLPSPQTLHADHPATARRRGATLAKRRPRLYARRKQGEIVRMDAVLAERRAQDSQIEYSETEAAPAPTYDDSDTAAQLRAQIERTLGQLATSAREQGENFTYVVAVTEDDDGRIVATVSEMMALTTEGTWIIDDATLDLVPMDAGRYAMSVEFPATTTFYNPGGAEVGGTSIGSQSLSGIYEPEINNWTSADGALSDISMWVDAPSEGLFRFDVANVMLELVLDESRPGKWSGPL